MVQTMKITMHVQVKLHFLSQSCLSVTLKWSCIKHSASVIYFQIPIKTLTNESFNISSSYACNGFLYFLKQARASKLGLSKQDSVRLIAMQNHVPRPGWSRLLHLFNTLRVSHNYSPFLAQKPLSWAVNPAGPCLGLPTRVSSRLMSLAFSWGERQPRVQGGPSSHTHLRLPT